MNWLNKLERKFGKYAIPNLMIYIIMLYAAGFLLSLINPSFYYQYLSLNAAAILRGQVWRIFTFIINPPSTSLIFIVFVLYMYYMLGIQLERVWGAFKFNLYFFSGMFFEVVAAILIYLVTGVNLTMDTWYLNMSLFFAFAALYPDLEFLLFMIIPIKAKWLAVVDGLYFLYAIVQAFLPAYGGNATYGIYYRANAVAAVVSILNFLIFFLSTRNTQKYNPKQFARREKFKRETRQARPVNTYAGGAKHRCAVCGRTELDDSRLEFRYCSKCNGNYEYCQDHLFTHQHVK